MKNKRTQLYADLVLLLVALLWGTTFVASKYALDYITPLYIIAIRFLLAFLMMAVGFIGHTRDISKSDLKGGVIVGTILYIAFATQLVALQYTTPGKQAFLAGTYVVMVPFIVWWLHKKRPDNRSFIGALICFIGIGMLTLNETLTVGYGDGLTLFSSLFFAGHIISNGHFVERIGPVKLTIVQFGTVAVLSTASALILEPVPVGLETQGLWSVMYLGILCTGVAYFLQTIGQKYTISTHTAIILSLEAVFGSLLSMVLMKEMFTLKMTVGCLCILAAVLVIELKGATADQEDSEEEPAV